MSMQSIPQHHYRTAEMASHLPQYGNDECFVDRAFRFQQIVAAQTSPPWRNREHADRRDATHPFGVVPKDGRLASQGPGALHQRLHQKAAFVPENEGRAEVAGFFLILRHVARFQRSTSISFCSRALRTGLCREKPRCLSKSGM